MRSAGPLGHAETVYTVLMRYHVQPVSDTFHGRDIFSRDEGATRAEEAHLHAYVLGLVTLVYKEVVDLADLLARLVVDLVSGEAVLDRHEPVAALFVLRHANFLVCASATNTPPASSPGGLGKTIPIRTRTSRLAMCPGAHLIERAGEIGLKGLAATRFLCSVTPSIGLDRNHRLWSRAARQPSRPAPLPSPV